MMRWAMERGSTPQELTLSNKLSRPCADGQGRRMQSAELSDIRTAGRLCARKRNKALRACAHDAGVQDVLLEASGCAHRTCVSAQDVRACSCCVAAQNALTAAILISSAAIDTTARTSLLTVLNFASSIGIDSSLRRKSSPLISSQLPSCRGHAGAGAGTTHAGLVSAQQREPYFAHRLTEIPTTDLVRAAVLQGRRRMRSSCLRTTCKTDVSTAAGRHAAACAGRNRPSHPAGQHDHARTLRAQGQHHSIWP